MSTRATELEVGLGRRTGQQTGEEGLLLEVSVWKAVSKFVWRGGRPMAG